MTPDLEKYRAAAKAQGDATAFSDEDILRLFACLEHLFARALTARCPHLLASAEPDKLDEAAASAVHSPQATNDKETRP